MNSYDLKRCHCKANKKRKVSQFRPAVTNLLKTISAPSKMKIFFLLESSPHCVCDIMAHTKMSQTLVSHHLSDLAAADLVRSDKNGAFVDYSLTDKGRSLMDAVKKLTL